MALLAAAAAAIISGARVAVTRVGCQEQHSMIEWALRAAGYCGELN